MPQPSAPSVVLLPGFNGTARQSVLMALDRALTTEGFACHRLALPRGRPEPGLDREVAWLVGVLERLPRPRAVVGRSFSGRVALRLAARHHACLDAVVAVSLPIRPPSGRRPLDEKALASALIPTLVVQGSRDELGAPRTIRALIRGNPMVTLQVIGPAVGHALGPRAVAQVAAAVAHWLAGRLPAAAQK